MGKTGRKKGDAMLKLVKQKPLTETEEKKLEAKAIKEMFAMGRMILAEVKRVNAEDWREEKEFILNHRKW
jgi:hypothetical protein